MAANTTPIFATTPRSNAAAISVANTARDGSGTVVTIATAGSNGSIFDVVRVVATGTTTAGVVRIFIHDGTNYFLYKEILVTAITPSTTVEVFNAELIPTVPLVMPAGYSIRAATNNAEGFNVIVSGGDF